MLEAFGPDIGYRIAHHADLTAPPGVEVHEHIEGLVWDRDGVRITVAPTIGFRISHEDASVEQAADTAARAGVGTLILTHCVPPVIPGQEDDWRAKAEVTAN